MGNKLVRGKYCKHQEKWMFVENMTDSYECKACENERGQPNKNELEKLQRLLKAAGWKIVLDKYYFFWKRWYLKDESNETIHSVSDEFTKEDLLRDSTAQLFHAALGKILKDSEERYVNCTNYEFTFLYLCKKYHKNSTPKRGYISNREYLSYCVDILSQVIG